MIDYSDRSQRHKGQSRVEHFHFFSLYAKKQDDDERAGLNRFQDIRRIRIFLCKCLAG